MSDKIARFPRAQQLPPARPAWLRGHARELWDRLAPAAAREGWLDELTAHSFALYCQAAADVRRLHALVSRRGMARAVAAGLFDALLAAQGQFLELAAANLCTPASRARSTDTGGS